MELSDRQMFLLILRSMLVAVSVRLFRRRIDDVCPPISSRYVISESRYDWLVDRIEKTARVFIFWRRKRCFYRSLCLMYILRQCDVPLIINFGFCLLSGNSRRRVHCWLTLNSKLFMEEESTEKDFPVFLGKSSNKQVNYWSGA